MNQPVAIIPISEARTKLGQITKTLTGDNYVILTKGGKARAALVDIQFLNQLQADLSKLYKKTFIDPQMLSGTREFSDAEVKNWEKTDALS